MLGELLTRASRAHTILPAADPLVFVIMPPKQKTGGPVTNAWCDMGIYNKNYIFGLPPVSGIQLPTPLEFPKRGKQFKAPLVMLMR